MTSGRGGLASNLPPVRQASAADVLTVAEFQTECWREAYAQRAGTVVGVISWGLAEVEDAPALELNSLYVAAAFRGSGLAGRLLR